MKVDKNKVTPYKIELKKITISNFKKLYISK